MTATRYTEIFIESAYLSQRMISRPTTMRPLKTLLKILSIYLAGILFPCIRTKKTYGTQSRNRAHLELHSSLN
jgi:hypothetical protein